MTIHELPDAPVFITTAQLARAANCSHGTVRRWLADSGIESDALLYAGRTSYPLYRASLATELTASLERTHIQAGGQKR